MNEYLFLHPIFALQTWLKFYILGKKKQIFRIISGYFMKHFIVEIIYKAPIDKINEVRDRHRAFLEIGYSKGIILMSGPQVPRTGGIIVARADSMEDLSEFLSDDPYRKEGVADYEFIEFTPVHHQDFMKEWI